MTGVSIADFAQLGEHAEPVEVRHHEVEDDDVDARPVRRAQERQPRLAGLGHDRLVAEAAHHRLQKPPLNRIVVDDENGA